MIKLVAFVPATLAVLSGLGIKLKEMWMPRAVIGADAFEDYMRLYCENRPASILVTGLPKSGKTVVALRVAVKVCKISLVYRDEGQESVKEGEGFPGTAPLTSINVMSSVAGVDMSNDWGRLLIWASNACAEYADIVLESRCHEDKYYVDVTKNKWGPTAQFCLSA